MLHDTRYIGKVTHDGIEYNNIFPSIVDENLWNLVQGLLSKNKAHRRLADDNEYLLVGKIFCGYCNYHMTGINSTSSTGKKYSYYNCRNKKNPNRNCHETIRKVFIEQTVLEQLHKLLNDEGLIEGITSSVVEYAHRRIEQSAVYKNATKRLNEIEKGLRNLLLAKEEFTRNNNMPFRQIDKRIEELSAEQDYYARGIQDEKESMDIDLQAVDVINYLSSKEILKAGSYNELTDL